MDRTLPQILAGINDEDLAKEQPLARSRILKQLQELGEWAKRHRDYAEKPDPRYAQLELACLKEETRIWKLGTPLQQPAPEDEPTAQRDRHLALVLGALEEIEKRSLGTG